MLKYILAALFMFHALISYSQKYDYIWVSGILYPDDSSKNFKIDFNQFPPKVESINEKIAMGFSNITMSDQEGALEFYTNGCMIRTKNHSVMEGGSYINSGPDSTLHLNHCGLDQSGAYGVHQGIYSLVNNQTYNLFQLRFDRTPQGPNTVCTRDAFMYSQIDMTANQGLGKLMFKDSVLVEGCFQSSTANLHANGRDWWIILPDNQQHHFYRYLFTPEGLMGPWSQDIENPTIDTLFFTGWSEFSSDGKLLIIYDMHSGVAIYDFDRCNGLLSNLRHIPADPAQDGWGWGAAISPNCRYLYLVKGVFTKLFQYDLQSVNIENSEQLVATWDNYYDTLPGGTIRQTFFGYFQHGPDGKLYNWAGNTRYVHCIEFPNREGIDCKTKQRAIKLPNYTLGSNAYYPNYRLGPIDGSACDTLGIDNHPLANFRYELEDSTQYRRVTFTDLSDYEPDTWHWDFGNGTTSQDTSPVHLYAQDGVYTVCLRVSNAFSADTLCRVVKIGVLGGNEPANKVNWSISPNPASTHFTLTLPEGTHDARLSILDLQGRVLREENISSSSQQVSTEGLINGTYFLRLSGEVTGMQKLVVLR